MTSLRSPQIYEECCNHLTNEICLLIIIQKIYYIPGTFSILGIQIREVLKSIEGYAQQVVNPGFFLN